jgi:hypothetical protein
MMGFPKLGNLCTIAIATSSSFSMCSFHEQRLNLVSFRAIYFVVIIIVMSLFMIPNVCVCSSSSWSTWWNSNFLMVNKKSSKRPRETKYLEHYYFHPLFSCFVPPLLLVCVFYLCVLSSSPSSSRPFYDLSCLCVCKHEITK